MISQRKHARFLADARPKPLHFPRLNCTWSEWSRL